MPVVPIVAHLYVKPRAPTDEDTRREAKARKEAEQNAIDHDAFYYTQALNFVKSTTKAQRMGEVLVRDMTKPEKLELRLCGMINLPVTGHFWHLLT